ncbi:MAG: hypothetical protein LBL82_00030 [Oscillospiraceae bacterium]|nr:hypothetical protein [Oscillospiraceae bacterium]
MMNDARSLDSSPRLLVAIIDRSEYRRFGKLLREKHAHFHFMLSAMGSANSEILKAFGFSGTEKTVCVCIEPEVKAQTLMTAVVERMELTSPGHGIAFTLPVSGLCTAVSCVLEAETEKHNERRMESMDKEAEKHTQQSHFHLVLTVVNQGHSDAVIDAAHSAGARGGTIIKAHRPDLGESAKFFGISLQSDKEVVAIVVPRGYKKELMTAINKRCGMSTQAEGIVISLPVDSCEGIQMTPKE